LPSKEKNAHFCSIPFRTNNSMANQTIEVLAFGQIAEIMQQHVCHMPLVDTVFSLKAHLAQTYPVLNEIEYLVSVNKKIVNTDFVLEAGNEVALLPPFSGG
jgi:molybdopterin converting factor small subunit